MAQSALRGAIDFFLFGLGIKVLGFVRSILMARAFGVNADTDAFYLALAVVFIFSNFLGGALTKVVIPVLSRAESRGGKTAKNAFLNNLLGVVMAVTAAGSAVLFLFADRVMLVFSNGAYPIHQLRLAALLFRIGLPTVVLYNLASSFRGYLQSEMMFRESSLSLLPVNLFYIIYLVAFVQFGLVGLMVTQVLGIAGQFVLQAGPLRRCGYRFAPRITFTDDYIKQTLVAFLPVFLATGAGELNAVIDKKLASGLAVGSISALDISATFNTTLNALFVSAVTVVLFPLISKALSEERRSDANRLMETGLRYSCLIAMPIGFALFVLAEPVVRLLFEGGRFDVRATVMTAAALRWYSVGLFAQALTVFHSQVLYAGGLQHLVVLGAMLHLTMNVCFNLVLRGPFGHAGLAAATSLSACIMCLFYGFAGSRKLGFIYPRALVVSLTRIGINAGATAIVARCLYPTVIAFWGDSTVGQGLALGCLAFGGGVLYLLLAWLAGCREWIEARDVVKRKFFSRYKKTHTA